MEKNLVNLRHFWLGYVQLVSSITKLYGYNYRQSLIVQCYIFSIWYISSVTLCTVHLPLSTGNKLCHMLTRTMHGAYQCKLIAKIKSLYNIVKGESLTGIYFHGTHWVSQRMKTWTLFAPINKYWFNQKETYHSRVSSITTSHTMSEHIHSVTYSVYV